MTFLNETPVSFESSFMAELKFVASMVTRFPNRSTGFRFGFNRFIAQLGGGNGTPPSEQIRNRQEEGKAKGGDDGKHEARHAHRNAKNRPEKNGFHPATKRNLSVLRDGPGDCFASFRFLLLAFVRHRLSLSLPWLYFRARPPWRGKGNTARNPNSGLARGGVFSTRPCGLLWRRPFQLEIWR